MESATNFHIIFLKYIFRKQKNFFLPVAKHFWKFVVAGTHDPADTRKAFYCAMGPLRELPALQLHPTASI